MTAGAGGTATEPVVVEMTDDTAVIVARALRFALGHKADWTLVEAETLQNLQAALSEMSR